VTRSEHGGDGLLCWPRRAARGRELSRSRRRKDFFEPDLINGSVRLVDVMATLDAIPSRMRIAILDACRNNPFPTLNDAGRGLAIVDAPNGSIVAYSTAPGTEALDGIGDHSPYTAAFLRLAHEKNLPIEQLFKRVRLEVNNSTAGSRPLGKLVADQRFLFLRRYRGRSHESAGTGANRLYRG